MKIKKPLTLIDNTIGNVGSSTSSARESSASLNSTSDSHQKAADSHYQNANWGAGAASTAAGIKAEVSGDQVTAAGRGAGAVFTGMATAEELTAGMSEAHTAKFYRGRAMEANRIESTWSTDRGNPGINTSGPDIYGQEEVVETLPSCALDRK